VHEPALADRRATGFEPIRITFDFANVESNGEGIEQQQYIKDIINRSKEWLEQALKVPRLSGNLVLPADFECGDVPSVPAKYTSTGAANTDTLIFVLSESSSDPDHPCASGLTTQPRMTSARATRAQREREREKEKEREREKREREERERERARERETESDRERAIGGERASERASERERRSTRTRTHARTHTYTHTYNRSTLAYASFCAQDTTTDRPLVGYIQMCPAHHQPRVQKGASLPCVLSPGVVGLVALEGLLRQSFPFFVF